MRPDKIMMKRRINLVGAFSSLHKYKMNSRTGMLRLCQLPPINATLMMRDVYSMYDRMTRIHVPKIPSVEIRLQIIGI